MSTNSTLGKCYHYSMLLPLILKSLHSLTFLSCSFPPKLFHRLSKVFNRSGTSVQYFISFQAPTIIIDDYDFNVELICKINTKMHGSDENHMCYMYKRTAHVGNMITCPTRCFGVTCDAQFVPGWKKCRSGLEAFSGHIDAEYKSNLMMQGIRDRNSPDYLTYSPERKKARRRIVMM